MPKRLAPPKSSSPAEQVQITDEWGIYDPAKAGMPALFKRLGRPVLRASAASARRERRRAQHPERTTEGVGLAIAEARKRAGLLADDLELPLVGGNPARAMRLALKAQAAANATPAAPFVLPAPAPPPDPVVEAAPVPAAFRKRGVRKADVAMRAETPAPVTQPAAVAPDPEPASSRLPMAAAKGRGRRLPAKARPRQAAVVESTTPPAAPVAVVAAVASAAPAPAPIAVRPTPPAPPPGRPRGPVPLAAWARAVVEPPKPEPRRSDKRGFWRGVFRMPMEVALVEYARGCRIHRLLVEAADDHVPDFI